MKIICNNSGLLEEKLKTGTRILIDEYKQSTEQLDINVEFCESDELSVKKEGNAISIICKELSHYYRGLTKIFCNLDKNTYENTEKAYFEKNGVILDCSRNAVFRVEKVKSII